MENILLEIDGADKESSGCKDGNPKKDDMMGEGEVLSAGNMTWDGESALKI